MMRDTLHDLPLVQRARMPLNERVADGLADLLFAADDLLQVVTEGSVESWLESEIRELYDRANQLMFRVTD